MIPNVFGKSINIMMIIIPIIKIIIGFFIFQIIKKIVKKMSFSKTNLKASQKQKIETLKHMLINIPRYIILILVGISLCTEMLPETDSESTVASISTSLLLSRIFWLYLL